ncbi:MAG TPA: hypothetical protein VGP26_27815 [Actinophytocola sp.]|nr:hypothetical protein [Actinophytocola sp.]
MNTSMETWENLQARLFHLGWLGEELPAFVARPSGAWLFRQIVHECQLVAAIAAEYVAETERAGLSGPDGITPLGDSTDLRPQVERGDAL